MPKYDFYLLFTENIALGIFFLVLSFMSVYLIIRKHVYSIYDPMFFFLVMGASGYSVVYFLAYFNIINSYYLLMFLSTQVLFFCGWKCFKPIKMEKIHKREFLHFRSDSIIYGLFSLIFIVSQVIVYAYKGIPLLLESRLEVFAGGGGFGIFNRLIIVSSTISLSIAFFRILYIKRTLVQKAIDGFMVLFFLLTQVLSGSKSGVLVIVFIYFLTVFYSQRFILFRGHEQKLKKKITYLACLSIPIALLTIYIQSLSAYGVGAVDFKFLIVGLMMRFVNTGDVFFMAWSHDHISSALNSDGAFLALFKDILSALRIYPIDELPVHMGLSLFQSVYNLDVLSGPNARHNVFGLFYFGPIGACFYSFLLGLLVGFIRNKLYYKLQPSYFGLLAYVSLAYFATFIEQDFSGMAMMYFFSFLLIVPWFNILAFILNEVVDRRENDE